MPFKAVIKAKSSKGTPDEIVDDNISSDSKDIQKEDDTEYINLSEPNDENLKFNQYQQVGQENNSNKIQDGNVATEQQNLLNASEPKVNIDSSSENIYKTLEPNVNISNENNLENTLFTNDNYQTLTGNQENNTQSIVNSNQNSLEYQDGTTLSSPSSTTASSTLGEIESNAIQPQEGMQSNKQILSQQSDNKTSADPENQVIYKTLQPGQILNDNDVNYGPEESIFDTPADQIKGEVTKAEPTPIKTDVKGETFVSETTSTGVTGQTGVVSADSFGVTGESKAQQTESFGVTGEKTVLDAFASGAKGDTTANFDNNQSNNIYKQVGPEGQVIGYDTESISNNDNALSNNQNLSSSFLNDNSLTESEQSGGQSDLTAVNTNKLTFGQMSSADSIQSQEFAEGTDKVQSDLNRINNDDKAIYGSLPQQLNTDKENTNNIDGYTSTNNLSDINSLNQIADQLPGALGETVVTQREFSGAKGVAGVTPSDFNGVKGESGASFSDAKGVTGTIGDTGANNNQQNNQQASSISDNTKKLIINRPNNQAQDLSNVSNQENNGVSISDTLNTDASTGLKSTSQSKTINIANIGQNAFAYEDIQSSGSRRALNQQGEGVTQELSVQSPTYKTITDTLGNTYQVDEYGNKISDSDFSYEEFKSENNSQDTGNKTTRYSTIDGVRSVEIINETSNQFESEEYSSDPSRSLSNSASYQSGVNDIANQSNTTNQSRSADQYAHPQAQSVYNPLSINSNNASSASRLTRLESAVSNQRDVKNYNLIQKLSMTINRALGIEPQSAKDEINLTNLEANQEFELDKGSTRVVNPRVTGLIESEEIEDEEERKNKRKKLRYKKVGYIEPELKAPDPIKLDDESQAFQDLYGERNRFDTTFSETNSALLRRAEEEIEKQSESVKEANVQESQINQPVNQDTESIYYIELLKERARLEQSLEDERESNRLAIRKSEDNIQQQLLDLILNNQNADIDSRPDDPINKLVQTLITDDKNKNSEQVVIDATRIVQMIQNQITESNGKPIDEYLLRKRIEEELKSEFIYMQKEQEKKMKLVYKKMLEDMYMDMINN